MNYKKTQCYGNAWFFLFKMSHHTSLSVKYSGRSLNFPPAQSTFEISLSEVKLRSAERNTYCTTSLHEVSCVTEVWCPCILVCFAPLGR